jgi:hypothetical protein
MAIKHLSVKDLTPEQRKEGADKARERLRALLANPFVTADQVDQVHARLVAVDKWERGED